MKTHAARYIHKRSRSPEAADLLQAIFTAELISPSRSIWIVSPWISDIPILDNRSNSFVTLAPEWGATQIRFSQVLLRLVALGTKVVVATRPSQHNTGFLGALRTGAPENGPQPTVHIVVELHEKGILGDSYYLGGSMNLTYNGITMNEEAVHYQTDPEVVARTRILLASRWPGGVV